ncbi:hypothetical protein DIPPA_04729 [Diplonema papillatum]|nr:hypothetical protein DIPPA_04729 [Diplonema papillatum]|eukprot:gene14168-21709_t
MSQIQQNQAAEVASLLSKPKCGHNQWDKIRVSKGVISLRCRTCLKQWRANVSQVWAVKCDAFQKDTGCHAPNCTKLHIHCKKLTLAERVTLHGAAVLDKIKTKSLPADVLAGVIEAQGSSQQPQPTAPAPCATAPPAEHTPVSQQDNRAAAPQQGSIQQQQQVLSPYRHLAYAQPVPMQQAQNAPPAYTMVPVYAFPQDTRMQAYSVMPNVHVCRAPAPAMQQCFVSSAGNLVQVVYTQPVNQHPPAFAGAQNPNQTQHQGQGLNQGQGPLRPAVVVAAAAEKQAAGPVAAQRGSPRNRETEKESAASSCSTNEDSVGYDAPLVSVKADSDDDKARALRAAAAAGGCKLRRTRHAAEPNPDYDLRALELQLQRYRGADVSA